MLLVPSAGRVSEAPLADLRSDLSQLLRLEPLALPALDLRVDVAYLPIDLAPRLILAATTEVNLPPFKPPRTDRPWRKPLAWTMVGVGAASLLSSVGCYGYAWQLHGDGSVADNDTIDKLNIVSGVTLGVGLAVVAGGIALLLLDDYAPLTPEAPVSP
jgi:hypothetical protein